MLVGCKQTELATRFTCILGLLRRVATTSVETEVDARDCLLLGLAVEENLAHLMSWRLPQRMTRFRVAAGSFWVQTKKWQPLCPRQSSLPKLPSPLSSETAQQLDQLPATRRRYSARLNRLRHLTAVLFPIVLIFLILLHNITS